MNSKADNMTRRSQFSMCWPRPKRSYVPQHESRKEGGEEEERLKNIHPHLLGHFINPLLHHEQDRSSQHALSKFTSDTFVQP